jgi:HPt (histidine-containing phosphotransfer) domain-containing protein
LRENESRDHGSQAQSQGFAPGGPEARFNFLKSGGFDPQALWDRVNGDVELLRELVEIFVHEYPLLLQKIEVALDHKSFEDVYKLSHKLKGSALQFSAARVAALAASLEKMGAEKSLEDADQVFARLQEELAILMQSLDVMSSGKGEFPV